MAKEKINIPGRFSTPGQKMTAAASQPVYDQIYVGTVVYVHPESNTMDIMLMDGDYSVLDVPILMPGMGPASMMGVMPERNSIVLLVHDMSTGGRKRYYPIAYFPPDPTGGRKYRVLAKYDKGEKDSSEDLNRIMVSRSRHLGEGDAILASSGGSEVYLDKDVEIHDGMGHELRLRQGDGSLLATSRNNYMFANGIWRGAGLIQRNSLVAPDSDPGIDASTTTMSDGRRVTYVGGEYTKKDAAGDVVSDEMYVEYRLDVEDTAVPHIPMNDVNSERNYTLRSTPKASFVLGNLVGNDATRTGQYGRFLAPQFIAGNRLSDAAGSKSVTLSPLSRDGTEESYKTRGVAWALGYGDNSFLGADKGGALHRFMGSTADRGWSMTTVATGGRRETWGADADHSLSWSAQFRGGLSWKVGKSATDVTSSKLPWGINIKSEGPTFLSHGSSNVDDTTLVSMEDSSLTVPFGAMAQYGRVEKVFGSAREDVTGDYELRVSGNYLWSIGGKFRYKIQGNFGESIFGDRSINTSGAFAVNSGNVSVSTGSRNEKIVTGDDDKLLMAGSSNTQILAGKQTLDIGVGGVETLVGSGDHKTTLAAGSFSMSIVAGNASVSTKAGNVELTTAVGSAKVGGVDVKISGTVSASVSAPSVTLGLAPTATGVITMLSHKDYMTGLPLIPSTTVTASA